jgi:hypothetical protein
MEDNVMQVEVKRPGTVRALTRFAWQTMHAQTNLATSQRYGVSDKALLQFPR